MRIRCTLPVLVLLSACNPDSGITRLLPQLAVAPSELDFGRVVVDDEAVLTLQVVNAGDGPLAVESITLVDDAFDGVYTVTPPTLDVAAGESAGVVVTFEPSDLATYDTALLIESNDPEAQLVSVPLLGEGIDGGPDIELSATTLDFGEVDVGSSATLLLTVSNVGDAPLQIDPASQQSGSGAFTLLTDPRNETIGIGGSFTTIVQYAPFAEGGDAGALRLLSNDPDDPEVQVDLLGNGGGGDDYPVALIDAFSTANPGETLILDGTGSYDPSGLEPLTYAWSLLEQPASSSAALSNPALSAPYLTLDTSGTYVVALQVTNTEGVSSATAVHTISADPEDAIYVELTWDADDADFDLHMIGSDPSLYYDGTADCCWCNPNPDWGEPGETRDDPRLAADAEGNGGPESILVEDPADGEYYVRAHYFQDNGAGITQATVKVYIEGELIEQRHRELTHNEVWEVGYVRWPQGYVIIEDPEPTASDERTCQ